MGEIMEEAQSVQEPVESPEVEVAENIHNGGEPSVDSSASDIELTEATRKIKIDGEYIEVPIEELEAAYGKDRASQKRFEEAAALRKEVDSFLDSLQKGELDNLLDIVPEDRLAEFAEGVLRKAKLVKNFTVLKYAIWL